MSVLLVFWSFGQARKADFFAQSTTITEAFFASWTTLLETLPNKVVGPKAARAQMEATLINMFRFGLAVRKSALPPEFFENLDDKTLQTMADTMFENSKNIELSTQEQKELDDLLSSALKPLDSLITKRDKGKTGRSTQQKIRKFNSVKEAEAANLPPGTQVIIGGRRAVIE